MRAALPSGVKLCDALIVIATAALGLALLRFTISHLSSGAYWRYWAAFASHTDQGPFGFMGPDVSRALVNGVPVLAVASLSVVCLSLRQSRPWIMESATRPGFVLCLAAVAACALTGLANSRALWMFQGDDCETAIQSIGGESCTHVAWRIIVLCILPNVGHTVLVTWIALALAGRYKPARSVVDRAGCIVAATWIALLLMDYCRWILEWAYLM
jgi:hypothetical protein